MRVLIVSDPSLPHAASEAEELEKLLDRRPFVRPKRLRVATVRNLERELRDEDYDVLHVAAHAYFDAKRPARCGIRLAGAVFSATRLADLQRRPPAQFGNAKPRPVTIPSLVVLAACESARTDGVSRTGRCTTAVANERYGHTLATALLHAGVRTLVGTFFKVPDRSAYRFSVALYSALVAGQTVDVATRRARRALYDDYDPAWGSFIVYGDDALVL